MRGSCVPTERKALVGAIPAIERAISAEPVRSATGAGGADK